MADDVIVQFGAQIDALTSAVDQVKAQLGEVGTSAEGMKGSFEGVGELIASVFSYEAISSFLEKMMDLGVTTTNMASIMGTTTERVAGLTYAADEAGTSVDTLARAGERLLLNIQRTATDALTPAAQALHNFGLSASDFQGLNFEQSFELLANRAIQYDNSQGQVTQGLQLLIGRSQQLIPLLLQGGDAFKEEVDRGQELGGLSENLTSQLKALHQAHLDLVTIMTKLGAEVAPGFTQALKDITNAVIQAKIAFDLFSAGNYAAALQAVGAALNSGATFADRFAASAGSLKTMAQATQTASDQTQQALAAIDFAAKDHLGAFIKQQEAVIAEVQAGYTRQVAIWTAQVAQHGLTTAQMAADELKLSQSTNAAEQARYQAILANDNLTATERAGFEAKLTALQDKGQTDRITLQQKYVTDTMTNFQNMGDSILSSWNSNLKGLIDGTTTWATAFKNLWQDLAVKVISFIESMLVKLAALAVAETVTGVTPAAGSIFSGGGLGSALGGIFKLQEGTAYVPQTGLAIVHEGEMVIPPGLADAIRSGTGAGGFAGNTQITFNISAWDGASVMTWLRGGGAQIISRTVATTWNQNPTLRPTYTS